MSGVHLSQDAEAKGSTKDFIVATPEEFVSRFGGTHVINNILIANNGIAAVKCMRSIRRWSYEMFNNDRAIRFVVMVTPEDLAANAGEFLVRIFFELNAEPFERSSESSSLKATTCFVMSRIFRIYLTKT